MTTKIIADTLDIERPTAYRAIDALEDDGVLEDVTGDERNKEFRATEIFEILERPTNVLSRTFSGCAVLGRE